MLALAPAASLHDHSSHQSKPVSRSKSAAVRRPNSSSTLPASSASSSVIPSSSSSVTGTPSSSISSASSASQFRPEALVAAKLQQTPSFPSVPASEPAAVSAQRSAHSTAAPMAPATTNTNTSVDIGTFPTPDLLRLLASLLNKLATANDGLSSDSLESTSSLTSQTASARESLPIWKELFSASRTALSTPTSPLTFHARNIPSISLEAYLLRILRYCPTTNEVFLSLLVYFDRMSELATATGNKFIVDSYNVHRLVIAGVTVASKFFSDVFYTNSRYAKVGGLPQAELNQLELEFLLLNDFRLSISSEELQRYADQLIQFSQCQSDCIPAVWNSVARPMQSMGAIDAFGGAVIPGHAATSQAGAIAPRNSTPKRSWSSATPSSSTNGLSTKAVVPDDPENSSVCSETDTDAETDDEPTIRPAHSCASSDTQSLFSSDASASEDGGFEGEDEGGDDEDDDDEGSATDDERPNSRRFGGGPIHHRWNSNASSVNEDRTMASP